MTSSLQAVREAAVDGRMHNVLTRRTQLEALQQTLLDHVDTIEYAIRADTGYSASEVAVEYLLTVHTLKEYYQSLDVERALLDEYAIARGEDATSRRDPVGIVYIVPTSYTFFYSVIVAVGGALAAGNCAVIELPNTLRPIHAMVKKLIENSLDHSTIAFVSSSMADGDLGPNHIRLYQDADQSSKTVAVVDRTADINCAAEALAAAQFSFAGQSPYAPDVVLVNEYIKESFLTAFVQAVRAYKRNLSSLDVTGAMQDGHETQPESDPNEGIRDVSSLGHCTIMETDNLDSDGLARMTTKGRLLVHPVRSLDHAIDLSNQIGKLRAAYVFAQAKSAKYLTQFIMSRVSCINHIPLELLVGPSAPEQISLSCSLRYPTTVFSVPHPQYSNHTPLSQSMMEVLQDSSAMPLQSALALRSTELILTSRRPLGGGVGFFEQGILTGMGLFSASILVGIGTLGYWAWTTAKEFRSHV